MNKIEDKKTPRAVQTREKTTRRKPWAPPSSLDAPPAPDGFKHRWIRAEVMGIDDNKNLSSRLREGFNLLEPIAELNIQLYRKENTKVL